MSVPTKSIRSFPQSSWASYDSSCRASTRIYWGDSSDDSYLCCRHSAWPSSCSSRVRRQFGLPRAQKAWISCRSFVFSCTCARRWLDCWRFHGQWRLSFFLRKFAVSDIRWAFHWPTFWCSSPCRVIARCSTCWAVRMQFSGSSVLCRLAASSSVFSSCPRHTAKSFRRFKRALKRKGRSQRQWFQRIDLVSRQASR